MLYTPFVFYGECYKVITDKEVPGVDPGRYYVSNYSCLVFDTYRQTFLSVCHVGDGYLSVTLHTSYGKKACLLHRLVAMAFIEGDFSLQVNHLDGKKANCQASNLEWATPRENILHAIRTGLQRTGENKPNAIISNQQAEIICAGLSERKRMSEILSMIGLPDTRENRSLIVDIKRGKTFKFISSKYNIDSDSLCEREFSNDIVHKICTMFQSNPSLIAPDVYRSLGFDYTDQRERKNCIEKIRSIRNRTAYTDISKHYVW